MSKEIIINVSGDQSRIAIVEDSELVELYVENPDNARTLGDIHLAQVRRVLPGIKAAFVDVGQKQDAFLHFSDLSDNLPELLELAEGRVKDHPPKALAKAPAGDAAENLELETPEEQLADRRRRSVKRSRDKDSDGRSRRARGSRKTKQEEAPDDTQQEATAEAASEAAEQDTSRRRGRRGKPRPEAEASAPDAALPVAPAILPPDTELAVSPSEVSQEEEDVSQEEETPRAQEAQPSDEPKPRSRRRRGRRSRKAKQEETPDDTQQEPQASGEDTPAEDESDKPKRSRRGGRRSRATSAETEAEAAPTVPHILPEETDASSEEGQAEEKKPRSRRAPRKSAQTESAQTEESSETAETAGDADDQSTSRRRGRRDTSRQQAEPAQKRKPEQKEEAPAQEKKEEEAPAPSPPTASGPTRLAKSSRFVIDLTSGSGKTSSRREEEEEEEEEATSSGRSRGRGRRRSSRKGGSQNGNSKSNAQNNGNGSAQDDDDEDDDGPKKSSSGRPPESYLRQGQRIIVKVVKEPISAKGSRVSTDVSLAGRFLVLIPAADYVAVSKKIESSKERRRLRTLARSLLPEGFGLIVRTVADGRDAKALDTDLRLLLDKWYKAEEILKKKPNPPVRLYEDVNMVSSIVRDLFSEDYDRIVVDDPDVYRNVKSYVKAVAPHMADLVQLHKGSEPVFRKYKVERDVRAAFEKRVSLPGGGYLFIEHTEAMHVVDVNSGRAGRGLSQEENALKVNLESAREIAKQLRLRDLGGIICVDFIDMRSDSYRKKVYDELKREFRRDRAVTKLLPMSDFGVVEITRQRLRPSITTTLDVDDLGPAPPEEEVQETPAQQPASQVAAAEEAPSVGRSASEVVAHLERWLATYREEVQDQHRKRPILLRTHPFMAAYLQRGVPSLLTRWRFKTWLKLKLEVDDTFDPLGFQIRDEKSGKNLTKKYDPERREEE